MDDIKKMQDAYNKCVLAAVSIGKTEEGVMIQSFIHHVNKTLGDLRYEIERLREMIEEDAHNE